MFPFRNILFPTDFSPHSKAALPYAAAFARHGGGRVFVIHVQDPKAPAAQWQFNELRGDIRMSGIDIERILTEGDPRIEIARHAVEHDIDLITVVVRERNRFTRAFGASIAEEIVAESPCAALAIRPTQRDFVADDGELRLKRVLLATNFRPSSVAATQLATQISNRLGAELHAVYVIGDYFEQISVIFPEGGLAALTRLRSYVQERMVQLSRMNGGGARTYIQEGRPYQEIVKLATSLEADLIVIGTAVHGSLFGNSQVLGSEIERVISNAPCPVLCVPAARVVTPLPALVTQAV